MDFNIDFRERADARFYEEDDEHITDLDVLAAAFAVAGDGDAVAAAPDGLHASSPVCFSASQRVTEATSHENEVTKSIFKTQSEKSTRHTAAILDESSMRGYKRARGAALSVPSASQHKPERQKGAENPPAAPSQTLTLQKQAVAAAFPRQEASRASGLPQQALKPSPAQHLVRLDQMFTAMDNKLKAPNAAQQALTNLPRSRGRASRHRAPRNAAFEQLRAQSGLAVAAPAQQATAKQTSSNITSLSKLFSSASVQSAHKQAASLSQPSVSRSRPIDHALQAQHSTASEAPLKPTPAVTLSTNAAAPGISLSNLFSQFTPAGERSAAFCCTALHVSPHADSETTRVQSGGSMARNSGELGAVLRRVRRTQQRDAAVLTHYASAGTLVPPTRTHESGASAGKLSVNSSDVRARPQVRLRLIAPRGNAGIDTATGFEFPSIGAGGAVQPPVERVKATQDCMHAALEELIQANTPVHMVQHLVFCVARIEGFSLDGEGLAEVPGREGDHVLLITRADLSNSNEPGFQDLKAASLGEKVVTLFYPWGAMRLPTAAPTAVPALCARGLLLITNS